MTSFGLWLDDPPSEIKKAAFWNELKRHGISTAAIMLEGLGNDFDVKFTIADLQKIGKLARERDIEIVLTCWPQPTQKYLNELEENIGRYLEACGASGLECDLEGNWKTTEVKGFPNLDKAGDRLVEILDGVRAKYDVRIEVTTFPGHTENTSRADVAGHADRLLPQGYSVRNRTSGPVDWDGRYGPGNMQRLTMDGAISVPNDPKLSCGLAAYDQVWPGKKGEEAMQKAYEAALAYKPVEIRLWSSKWVIGIKKNGYASRWLLKMKKS